jgi:hypothetical protein
VSQRYILFHDPKKSTAYNHDTDIRYSEALDAYADDDQCTRIFFAGWQRPPYFAGLSNKPEKVTLIQGHTMAPGLERISFRGSNKLPIALEITTFAGVFMPPNGRDLFRCNFLKGSGCKSWVCSDSIKVRTNLSQRKLETSL